MGPTSYLFPKPTFLRGMASLVDLGGLLGNQRNRSDTTEAADARAILADVLALGEDARQALDEIAAQLT